MCLLKYEGVRLAYGRNVVLRDVNLHVEKGDFLGLVGPNGSGKTTLIKSMLGLIRPKLGTIDWRGGIPRCGYVPQQEEVDPIWPMRVRDLLKMTICSLRPLHLFHRKEPRQVREIMELIGIEHLANQTLDTLSGGEMQRVLLARALVVEPEVVLLDEPTSGMDLVAAERFLSLISKMHKGRKMTVIMVTHDLPSLVDRAQHLGIIENDTLYSGRVDEILTSEMLTKIYREPLTVRDVHGRTMILHGSAPEERSA